MNKLLTPTQKEVIKPFFKHYEYAGWENIADKLIDNGVCIVAGTSNIWIGGIGNFIKTKSNDFYIGCLEYTFNLEEFINSKYFQSSLPNRINNKQSELDNLGNKKLRLEEDIYELNQLIK